MTGLAELLRDIMREVTSALDGLVQGAEALDRLRRRLRLRLDELAEAKEEAP